MWMELLRGRITLRTSKEREDCDWDRVRSAKISIIQGLWLLIEPIPFFHPKIKSLKNPDPKIIIEKNPKSPKTTKWSLDFHLCPYIWGPQKTWKLKKKKKRSKDYT